MAKTHRLTNLVFDEVSSVDKGAGEGVRVVLAKRDTAAPINSTTENDPMPMTADEKTALEKQIAETVAKSLAPVVEAHKAELAKRDEEIMILKLSPELQEFRKAMSPEEKKKFDAMTAEEKAEAAKETKKRAIDKLDPEIKKRLDQADEDRKIVKALVEKDEIATFEKRAVGLGLAATDGEVLRKAYSGDAAAQTELDKRLKALTEQVKVGKVFDEFGASGSGKGDKTAYDEIVEKGAELRKTKPQLTPEQARVEVMNDPANADLMKRHNAEKVMKLSRAA